MHKWVRSVPWSLALVGLAIPLVGSGFVGLEIVVIWLAFLGLAWLFGRHLLTTRTQRIIVALVALPVLLVPLAWWGGWWLIPADLAWLAIEVLDRPRATGGADGLTLRPATGGGLVLPWSCRLPVDCGRVRWLADGPR